jgi:hypothetical protein
VHIDKSNQRLTVSVDGTMGYNWPVSTGREATATLTAMFHPQSIARYYFSRKCYNAPMPHPIFFYCGFAVYGTTDISRLARLRQVASCEHCDLVRAGRAQRRAKQDDRDFELAFLNCVITVSRVDQNFVRHVCHARRG